LALAFTADVTYVSPGSHPNLAYGFYGGEGYYAGASALFEDNGRMVPKVVGGSVSFGVGVGFKTNIPKLVEGVTPTLVTIPLTDP
jgi:hypothetical protein